MRVIYSDQNLQFDQPSIFLAGPTHRKENEIVPGSFWRRDAVKLLELYGHTGTVFVPELSTAESQFDYENQVDWEYEALEKSSLIAFWIPRNMKSLSGLTTNVEFGRYVGRNHTLYGRPDDSEKNRYLDWLYYKIHRRQPLNDLRELMKACAWTIDYNQKENTL